VVGDDKAKAAAGVATDKGGTAVDKGVDKAADKIMK
jgi:hypothetical protein